MSTNEFVTQTEMEDCKKEIVKTVESTHEEVTELRKDIKELLAIYKNARGFIVFLGWIGSFIRKAVLVIGALALAYAWLKGWLHDLISIGEIK